MNSPPLGLPEKHCGTLAQLVSTWLQSKKLPETLSINDQGDGPRSPGRGEAKVETALREYQPGELIVAGNAPLRASDVELLQAEYNAMRKATGGWEMLRYSWPASACTLPCYVLCGAYIQVHHPRLLIDIRRLRTLLGAVVVTVTLCAFDNRLEWRGAIIPLVLFGATVAIAYGRELALLLTAVVALMVIVVAWARRWPIS